MRAAQERGREEWDASVRSEVGKPSVEDKVAQRLANEILKDNQKLKGVHSNQSIRLLLEKEAKKQLMG